MPVTVLILMAFDDGEGRLVADELRRRGHRPVPFDLSDFPIRASLDARLGPDGWDGRLRTPDTSVDLTDVTAVYHRRCPSFELPETMNAAEQRFSRVEARFGLGGVLASLPAHWVSHPSAMADAEYKPVQYVAATRVGLPLPPTWVGNTPEAARAFLTDQGGSGVYKPLMHKLVADSGQARLIYTTPTRAAQVDDRVTVTAHQFQQHVRAEYDVRALVTRTGCEAVAITIEGRTVFYEVNPAGQWAWLMEETGAPMTGLICDELTEPSR
ncbi:MvdC/MvdD family ATP grasp protein [Nocardiopsis sp. NPDC049922]|uniref:MvdC/MvdD family ATP grasp protein n=1 Tax=Nocardiopsis sp. NPDC049922 TaxID=3155157 RepID=UPI0033DCF333